MHGHTWRVNVSLGIFIVIQLLYYMTHSGSAAGSLQARVCHLERQLASTTAQYNEQVCMLTRDAE